MDDTDKLLDRLEELRTKHKELDKHIKKLYNTSITEELRKLKTEKLWLKDEIYRIERQLISEGVYVNGYHGKNT
tara:strand:+ start:445 stop:666 length:222 start_codon:yes stop_codon:yes gene_type:complete